MRIRDWSSDVCSSDLRVPASLKVIGAVPAGDLFGGSLGAGEAVRIFTGAPLPNGADAIVIQEDTEAGTGANGNSQVKVKESCAAGNYVRPAGRDFAAGDPGPRARRALPRPARARGGQEGGRTVRTGG